jgi:dTDP-glucose 4,6-dehydratase
LSFDTGRSGETYNIGGRNEKTNNQICDEICTILDQRSPRKDGRSYKEQIKFVEDRPGHDLRYAVDATKIENELSWKADENFSSGILKTIEYYLND